MNDSIRPFIHTKQLNTRTTRTTKTTTSTWVSLVTKVYALTTETTQILQYLYSNSPRNWPISYISSITKFVHFTDTQKSALGLLSNFLHFIHPYMNPLPLQNKCDHEILGISTQRILHNVIRIRNWVLILFWRVSNSVHSPKSNVGSRESTSRVQRSTLASRSRKSGMPKKP